MNEVQNKEIKKNLLIVTLMANRNTLMQLDFLPKKNQLIIIFNDKI
jgi:hypothetical protein